MRKAFTVSLFCAALLCACGQPKEKQMNHGQEKMKQNEWRQIEPQQIEGNAVSLFGEQWALLTAGTEGDVNTMTIAWGSLGMLWSVPVMNVYVSSDRYTHSFMERNDRFTVAFFPEEYRDALVYLGTHSGRDGDKIAPSGLHLEFMPDGQPSFAEATMLVECRKIYGAPFREEALGDIPQKIYERGMGIHSEYVGQIEKVWVR